MPSQTNTPDAPQSAKILDAPSTSTATKGGTIHQSTSTDHLRNQWAHVVAEFDRNIDAFTAYVADVRERIAEDNGWTGGTDHLRNFIRDGRFISAEGNHFKVNHNHCAVWCREVCKRWPDVAPHILPTLRASKFDRFYRRSIFSDEYLAAISKANAHPEVMEEV